MAVGAPMHWGLPVHYVEGMRKKRHPHALFEASFFNNPEVPFGLDSLDLEALDRLMAERERQG